MEGVITYNLADDFIDQLACFIEGNYLKQGKDLSRLAVVFGGRRPSLFLRKALAEKIKKSYFPPKFFTIDEFIEYTLEKKGPFSRVLDLDACFTIYHLAKKHAPSVLKGRETFSQFLPWAREILRFIEQLDLEEVKIKSLEDIQLNAAIGYDVPQSINTLLTHIVTLRDIFHKILMEQKTYSRGLSYMLASASIHEIPFDEFDQIFFCNFFYLHKTEETVIKSLYESKKALVFFQGDEREWSVLEKISKSLDSSIQPQKNLKPRYELSIDCGFDLHSQVCLVREKLKTIEHRDKTVIVLPDPDSLIPLLSEMTTPINDFNVSMGYPLKRSSLYSLFEDLFKAQETKKGKEYYAKDYLRLLSHPLIKNLAILGEASVTRVLVHKIEEIVLGIEKTSLGGSLFVKLDDIQQEERLYEATLEMTKRMDIKVTATDLKSIVQQLHRLLFQAWETIDNFSEFTHPLQEILELLLKKSFLDKYPLNLKILERIFSIIEELKHTSFHNEAFPKEDIFKIFKNKLDNEMVSFSGSPLKGLQILGLLETRALSFENVIVMDVNEAVLPKLKIYEPLIPRDVMMSLGLNRLEKEEEIQRYQFMRLIASAKKVHLFYQETEDKEKSRFIEELIWERQKASRSLDVFSISRASFKMKVLSREIEIAKKPHHIAFLKEYRYSASSLNIYLHCPLRFFYQHVLGLEEKEDLLEEPEGKDIGTFIHHVLEETFLRFVGRRPNIDDSFREYFFDTLDKEFENEFRRKMKSDAFLIKEVLAFRLKKFLDNEKKRRIKELLCIEKVFEDRIKLAGQHFKFKSKIDRIDRLEDNSLLIIDYKTGSTDVMPARINRLEALDLTRESIKDTIKSFQLPLYCYFVQQTEKNTEINAALYNLRNPQEDSGLKKLFDEDQDSRQKEKIMSVFMRAMEFIILEILNPEIPFKADQEDAYNCNNCPFFYLCR